MKIHRLRLRNWRGVQAADVSLGDGVTVIEGPNEVGKSSIVEALLLLFNELDSSKKRAIQAVKPVGVDAGSEVSAEISAGPYRFSYSKTYNKSPSTTLELKAPENRQLTGREAHDHVTALLSEIVDMTLWQALLVSQGESLAPAELKGSGSLLKALDEAAGTAGQGDENPDLFAACQAEYERYFTLKTGKPRFLDELTKLEAAKQAVETARAAMAAVEQDSEQQERCQQELDRLQAQLPELTAQKNELEEQQRALESQRQALAAQQRLLQAAAHSSEQVAGLLRSRQRLADEISEAEKSRDELRRAAEPGQSELELREKKVAELQARIADLKQENAGHRSALRAAEGDLQTLKQQEQLATLEQRLEHLAAVQAGLAETTADLSQIKVTDIHLKQLRAAERELELARGQLSAATTVVEVVASRDLKLAIGNSEVELAPGESVRRQVDEETALKFPGVAELKLMPPSSAEDLRATASDAEEEFQSLLKQCAAVSPAEAEAALQRKNELLQRLRELKTQEKTLLGGESAAELRQQLVSTREELSNNQKDRDTSLLKPRTASEAERAVTRARQQVEDTADRLEQLRAELDQAQTAVRKHAEKLRHQQQAAAVQQSLLESKQQELERQRAEESDAALEQKAQTAAAEFAQQRAETQRMQQELDRHSSESVQALLENAVTVHEQTVRQINEQQQALAVANDRLESARADGRFETLEAAERECEHFQQQTRALTRRAEAAKLLWNTLNRCREQARQAYVEPLRDAVLRLGRIVFGSSFGVKISDSWEITHRELDGVMLPVESLSIGAREQLGLLTRLAAAQIVSSQGGVPVIIDDALGFADPQRLKTMGAAIAAAGRSCQVIVLTCTPGRFQNIGGANFVKLGANG